jgi:hypothetical protein
MVSVLFKLIKQLAVLASINSILSKGLANNEFGADTRDGGAFVIFNLLTGKVVIGQ